MKKIIPALIFTAAASTATLLYIKKKLTEKNEIKLIEIEEKKDHNLEEKETNEWTTSFDPLIEKVSEVTSTIDTIVDGLKEEIANKEPIIDKVEQNENEFIDESLLDEIAESNIEESDTVEVVDTIENELEDFQRNYTDVSQQFEAEDLPDKIEELPIEEIVQEEAIPFPEMEPTDDDQQKIVDEINEIINEIIQPTEEEALDDLQEAITYDDDQPQQVQEQTEQETSTELDPIEFNDKPLDPLDTAKTAEIVINSIIDSVEEVDQNQQAMDDIEQLIEDEVEQVNEDEMTNEELVEKYSRQFESISPRKIELILKQIDLMRKSIANAENITLQHYVKFDTQENRDKYGFIAQVEGYIVENDEDPTKLLLVNTLENNRHTLNWSILDLARNVGEYNGSYRGWAVRETK